MVHTLTRWAIKSSLEELVRWRRCDPDLRVSVNVSARNLIDVSLVTDVRNILREVGLPGEALTLEITESTVMAEPQRSIAVLDRLRELGVRFAIDDFGTGYSSLSYLKRLPVDEVKIDKSFVRDMAIDSDLASIVRSTIDLARNLDLMVIAEGVEDEVTIEMLGDLGCDVVQGYYFARPTTSDEVEQLLLDGHFSYTAKIDAGIAQAGDLVPVATELEQDLLGVLSEFRRAPLVAGRGVAEAHGRQHGVDRSVGAVERARSSRCPTSPDRRPPGRGRAPARSAGRRRAARSHHSAVVRAANASLRRGHSSAFSSFQ